MGTLDYLIQLLLHNQHNKQEKANAVEIKVKMDCDGCERRVKNAVRTMNGVKSVVANSKLSRVMVTGYVELNKVLKRVKSTEFWPYIPQHLVYYLHAAQVYDKRAPAGYVRNMGCAFPSNNVSAPEEKIAAMFRDANVNACSIM